MRPISRREMMGGTAAVAVAGCTAVPLPVAVVPPALSPVSAGPKPTESLLAAMAEQLLAEYPEAATYLGVDKGPRAMLKHRLTDRTAAGRQRLAAAARGRLAVLKALDTSDLSAPFALDAAVARAAHEITDEGYRFAYGDVVNLDPNYGYRNMPYVVNQLSGAFVEIPDLIDSRHTIETEEDADAFGDRVDEYARMLDGETERMVHDRGIGVVAPDFIVAKTLKMIADGASQKVGDTVLAKSIAKGVKAAKLSPAHVARVEESIRTRVLPALQRQAAELARHRGLAKHDAGVWSQPDGDAYYRWALKAGTTSSSSPQEIHQIGLEQVRLINERMDSILRKQGMTGGSVADRLRAVGKRPGQLFPNTDAGRAQLLAYLNGLVEDVRARLPRAFATLVPGNLVIKRVPPEIQDGAPGGYAAAGSIDGKVPGQYYINLRDTADWPKFTLPTLTYHEGIPGHIWQGEYSNQLPLIRSLIAFNAYSEGWALYAEQLADELGVYDGDPFGALGYLQSSAFRACRLVVDTGIHALKWSREQGIDFFVQNNGESAASVTSEVERYCAWPGQACGYKMGHLEIVRLREKAKTAMGARYDLRTFNDAVVKGGAVPMTLLETVIDRYIGA